jgi:hypothetical protein
LPVAADAPFNAYQRQHESDCLQGTRVDLLHDIYNWADGQGTPCIFWLSGLAGTGKSTISRTIARRYDKNQRLGASFFFSKGDGDISHAGKFVTSIAVQLANNVQSLKQIICNAITERSNITSLSLRDQWHHLVLGPLSKLAGNTCQSQYILVVDALDECDDENNVRSILEILAATQSLEAVKLRIFLTSRPEVPIRSGLIQIENTKRQDVILHDISRSIVDHDIRIFLEHNLKIIAIERSLVAGWPGEEIVRRLVQNASGLFIWAATAYRFIRKSKFATKSLDMILAHSSATVNAPEKHLNEMYITVLRHCISEYPNEEEELQSMLKSVLGSIVTLASPLSIQSLSKLLSTPQDEVDQTLYDLHAILNIPKDPTCQVHLHHPSFRDFLFKKARCEEFWVDEKQAHQILADRCMQLMSTSLKQDIYGVNAPNMLIADAERDWIEQGLPPEVQYACRYWTQHVEKSGTQLCDNSQVYCFLQRYFLHWLEALGWMRRISDSVYAIAALELYISVSIFPA